MVTAGLQLKVARKPLIDSLEEPAQLTELINQLSDRRRDYSLWLEDKCVLHYRVMNELPLNALEDKEQVSDY